MIAAPMPTNYANIPLELQERRQWVMYRLEPQGDKTTKIPYRINGRPAASTNPDDWASFSDCVAALSRFDGIGFVFCDDDPYTGIDLDYTVDESRRAVQTAIFNAFGSYSEKSVSGLGCHIIVRGRLPVGGKRIPSIETYSTGRFFTMTGDVVSGRYTITDTQFYVDELYRYMCSVRPERVQAGIIYDDTPQTTEDADIIAIALRADNGHKFKGLYEGAIAGVINTATGQPHANDDSGADQALMNIIAFYSRNLDQTIRIFMGSARGAREKCQLRPEYVRATADRAFDNVPSPVDILAMHVSVDAAIAATLPAVIVTPAPEQAPTPYRWPAGLVGEMAAFIYAASPRPVPEIALAGALGFMAGICGNSYNVSGTGLNMYVALIALAGTGKEAMNSGINKIISQLRLNIPSLRDYKGPSTIASAPALRQALNKHSSFVSIHGEFAKRLKAMTSDRASHNDDQLLGEYLDLYGKSGQDETSGDTVYSDTSKNIASVNSPAFTLLAESETTGFFQALNEGSITGGFLPRLTVIESTAERPDLNENARYAKLSENLRNGLIHLVTQASAIKQAGLPRDVPYADDADAILRAFDHWCTLQVRNRALSLIERLMWSRAYVKVVKLAACVAVGCDAYRPTIDPTQAQWAVDITRHEIELVLARFKVGKVGYTVDGSEEDLQVRAIANAMREYLVKPFGEVGYKVNQQQHAERQIPYSYLMRRVQTTGVFRQSKKDDLARNIKRCLDRLSAMEIIQLHDVVRAPGQKGPLPVLYLAIDADQLFKIADG